LRRETIRRLISFGLLLVLVMAFGLTSQYFFTSRNIFLLLRESAIIGILAVGVTMVIISGGNDLSCGALLGLSAMVMTRLVYSTELPMPAILLVMFLVSACGGLLNGYLVAVLRIPDFIATLSSQFVFTGLTMILALRTETGMITTKPVNDPLIISLNGHAGGLFYVTIVFFVVAAAGQFLLKNTKLGTHVYAVGSNRNSAELSGINHTKTKFAVFMISAMCAFIGSLFFMAKIRSAETTSGIGMEFQAIAATVIGGCSFSGGRGDVLGTVIGVMFLKVLENGIFKFNLRTQTQQIASGVIIVAMLLFDAAYNRYMQGKVAKSAAVAREKRENKAATP
jgi:ribose transport system permease protein